MSENEGGCKMDNKITVKVNAEVIAEYTDYRDMSRYVHIALFINEELTGVSIFKVEE